MGDFDFQIAENIEKTILKIGDALKTENIKIFCWKNPKKQQ